MPEEQVQPGKRCAVYTRKSTGHGLDRDFNSLENQREVCSAYISSQRHKGWSELAASYEDAAQSGGTIERPALQQLLRDIERGRVDVVVVYKIDRLTRSLADFTRMMDLIERFDVAFVSVTQAFDTSDSMGRLVLNILLTFAQFEREMLADRVRDKIGAMRRRGMHVGGRPPYGYDVIDGRLVVNPREADKVRAIFRRYLELGSYQRLQAELRAEGMLTKRWTTRAGVERGGTLVSSGMIYSLLGNPVYAGKVVYDGETYEGAHEAILSDEVWQAASALRARHSRNPRHTGPTPHLLLGLLFDSHGRRMMMRIDRSGGRRFRYYTSEATRWSREARLRRYRSPADELEALVLAAVRDVLCDRERLRGALFALGRHGRDAELLPGRGEAVSRALERADIEQKRELLLALVVRGEVSLDGVQLLLRCSELERVLAWDGRGVFRGNAAGWSSRDPTLPVDLRTPVVNSRRILVLPLSPRQPSGARKAKAELVKLVRDARRAQAAVDAERDEPITELCRRFHWQAGFFARILRLNYLAPDIVAAILDGTQPEGLTRRILVRANLPMDWALQRQLFGFPPRADHQRVPA